jgi:hypothetical protein
MTAPTLHRAVDVGKGPGKPGGFPRVDPRVARRDQRRGTWGNMVPPRERGQQPRDVDQAMRIIAGTAQSMGVETDVLR